MSKIIELKDGDFAFVMESRVPDINGNAFTIKLFAGEEQIGLYQDLSIIIENHEHPKIEVTFIGGKLKEADRLILSKHLKDRIRRYVGLLRKIPGIMVRSPIG